MKKHLMLATILTLVSASFTEAAALDESRFGIFGVTVKGDSPVFSKALVRHAADAASAFGIRRHHTIEAIDGIVLTTRMFDSAVLTPAEREVWAKDSLPPIQPVYIQVTGVFGGGCLAAPTWSLPGKAYEKPKPVGITNMRCAKTAEGFTRLKKVYGVVVAM